MHHVHRLLGRENLLQLRPEILLIIQHRLLAGELYRQRIEANRVRGRKQLVAILNGATILKECTNIGPRTPVLTSPFTSCLVFSSSSSPCSLRMATGVVSLESAIFASHGSAAAPMACCRTPPG
jgi:hypothetical protein